MKPIEDLRTAGLAELQEQKNRRDAVVKRLRAEMAEIHDLMEPIWLREQALAAAPEHLAQVMNLGRKQ